MVEESLAVEGRSPEEGRKTGRVALCKMEGGEGVIGCYVAPVVDNVFGALSGPGAGQGSWRDPIATRSAERML